MESKKLVMMVAIAVFLVLALGQVVAGKQPCKHINSGSSNPMHRTGCSKCCAGNGYKSWINNTITGCRCLKKNRP